MCASVVRSSFIVVSLLAPLAHAQVEDAAATAHRLMIRSGMSVQLRGFTDQVVAEIRQNSTKLDERMVAALIDAAKQAFRADLLQEDLAARVAKKLTVGDMKAALAWLETDPGERVTKAEELASTSLDVPRLREYADRLKTNPITAKRQNMIAEVISATNAVRAAAVTAETIAFGVAVGMDSLQPRERRVGEAALRARLRDVMPPEKLRAGFAEQLPIIFAYMYRDISDTDIAGYLGFLKGIPGKRYQDAMNAAFTEGLGRASVQVGELAGQAQQKTAL